MSSLLRFSAAAFIMMIFLYNLFLEFIFESSAVVIRGWKQVKQQFEPNIKL
jgi:hypothetical protein